MQYKNETIEKFLEKLSSSESMPGGGTAAALTAAEGVSLIEMVCNLSIGKEKYKEYESLIINIKNSCEENKKTFLYYMDEDAKLFKEIEKVFALPRSTEEEKKIYKKEMEKACKICCDIPKKIIELCDKSLKLVLEAKGKSNKSAASDLEVAEILLIAAKKSAWQNILINLKYILDEEFIKNIKNSISL